MLSQVGLGEGVGCLPACLPALAGQRTVRGLHAGTAVAMLAPRQPCSCSRRGVAPSLAAVPHLPSPPSSLSPLTAPLPLPLCLQDPFGNYVVQYVLELGHPETSTLVMANLKGHYSELATQKFRCGPD